MQRTNQEIEVEAQRLEARAARNSFDPSTDSVAAETLRNRLTPGQVVTGYSDVDDDIFESMFYAANWLIGLVDVPPFEALS